MGEIDLTLLWGGVQQAGRDAKGALAAVDRLIASITPRIDALESRVLALEQRQAGVERAVEGLRVEVMRLFDGMEAQTARIMAALSDISAKVG